VEFGNNKLVYCVVGWIYVSWLLRGGINGFKGFPEDNEAVEF